ncbi:MAG: TIGR01777 family protein [Deltaproteobacteria bacterium]|nr:TIGR01777 family protein [Deltaproteobacteria bacterium]
MRVFLTGATGLIGRALSVSLLHDGHQVVALSRGASPELLPGGVERLQGDPAKPGPWQEVLAGCQACVNLAGEPVAGGRWNAVRKEAIRQSRVEATRNVAAVIAECGPTVLVQGSAVGFYGSRGDEELTEGSAAGTGFLAEVCQAWEEAARPAARRARLVLLRTGIVLAREGGALPQMALPFRLFAGGPIGDGAFWQPWIHLDDQVSLVRWALAEPRAEGPVNAAAPAPARNRDLARAIGAALSRPSFLPTPALVVRLAVGEMAEVVTSSQRVLPRKAESLGFRFTHADLGAALRDLLE